MADGMMKVFERVVSEWPKESARAESAPFEEKPEAEEAPTPKVHAEERESEPASSEAPFS
jgi:hypothetical protein